MTTGNMTAIAILAAAVPVLAAVGAAARWWPSARLFVLATAFFAWTAGSLVLDLHHRDGWAGHAGWLGILGAGPIAILLSVIALVRYGHEQSRPGEGTSTPR